MFKTAVTEVRNEEQYQSSKYTTSQQRRCNVLTLQRRCNEAKHTASQQRRYNVAATLWRCSDVVTKFLRHCVFAGNKVFIIWTCLFYCNNSGGTIYIMTTEIFKNRKLLNNNYVLQQFCCYGIKQAVCSFLACCLISVIDRNYLYVLK